jgi:pullulanase
MLRINISILLFMVELVVSAQTLNWLDYPVYNGSELGLTVSTNKASFRIYAPTAQQARLRLYDQGTDGVLLETIDMEKSVSGTWHTSLTGNHIGKYYVFQVKINNSWSDEIPDPYVKCVGVNGKRGMIIDLNDTNPTGWDVDTSPEFNHPVDALIYELHVRDASIHANSGIKQKGKFLGLTENQTKNSSGLSTGLDHIKELGVTHIHLLPSYDFNSIDESIPNNNKYNWGYDPLNYNVPEGSYSTNAHDGAVRIREFKKLIQTFHQNGLRVVLDVVYNHTALTHDSYFNQLVPGYYYRQTAEGAFSNGSACGNETASDRPMMRKFMLESVIHWVKEYHIDGFRFDLMGIHDIETMNLISDTLHKIKPDILLYGEGWTAGQVQIPDAQLALKKNASKLRNIAVFSDDIRDGIKGSVFNYEERGFASGETNQAESVKFGIVAACNHPQIDFSKVKYSKESFAAAPASTVSYVSCHDNHTLWDKLHISMPQSSVEDRKQMQKLALSIVLTSQGVTFLHAGTEFLKSKQGVENSFESPDSINAIDWDLKTVNRDVFDYVRHLITIRKQHPAFRLQTKEQLFENIQFMKTIPDGVVAFTINGKAVGDSWNTILVAFNGAKFPQQMTLPSGKWKAAVVSNKASNQVINNSITLAPYSCAILNQ